MKNFILFLAGGLMYVIIELLWRHHSHWSMFIIGGICFLYASLQNEYADWEESLLLQGLRVDLFITSVEFLSGCFLNLFLKLNIWDYSNLRFNLFGQVSLLYSILWYPLSIIAIVLDDYIRYYFFGEEKPRYKF